MKTDCSGLYYSSLPNEAPKPGAPTSPTRRKDTHPSPSPRKTIENASSSISNVVATSVNSARKIKDKARSFVPKKLLPVPPVPISKGKKGGLGHCDEVTPVIFYTDEDPVAQREDDTITFLDPFSFEDSEGQADEKEAHDNSTSPTSIVPVRLFPGDSSNSNIASTTSRDNCKEGNNLFKFDEMVSFDCPIFTQDFNFGEEDTSIDVSEAIKSINDLGIKGIRSFRESIRAKKEAGDMWEDTKIPASWALSSPRGFQRSSSFTMYEWEPITEDSAIPST